jgi:adenylate kinase family enzyme
MGARNYLIEGVSGAGKTAVAEELQRRGYQVVHGDRALAYLGDPETGRPMTPETGSPTARWRHEHHVWDVGKVRALVADQAAAVTFFCGGSRNLSRFIDLFDGVFVLEVSRDTMNRRIDQRVAADPSDFGATPEERDLIEQLYATKAEAEAPGHAVRIDANGQLARVVDDILSRIGWLVRPGPG